jgi:hypothetical protein
MLRVAIRILVAAACLYIIALQWVLPRFIDPTFSDGLEQLETLSFIGTLCIGFLAVCGVTTLAVRMTSKKAPPKADAEPTCQ